MSTPLTLSANGPCSGHRRNETRLAPGPAWTRTNRANTPCSRLRRRGAPPGRAGRPMVPRIRNLRAIHLARAGPRHPGRRSFNRPSPVRPTGGPSRARHHLDAASECSGRSRSSARHVGSHSEVDMLEFAMLHMPVWFWRPGRGFTQIHGVPFMSTTDLGERILVPKGSLIAVGGVGGKSPARSA